jgi:hypothetical protein
MAQSDGNYRTDGSSVRTEPKKMLQTKHRNTENLSNVHLKLNDWMVQSDGNVRFGRTDFCPSVQNQKMLQTKKHRNTENLGVIHLKELNVTDGTI